MVSSPLMALTAIPVCIEKVWARREAGVEKDRVAVAAARRYDGADLLALQRTIRQRSLRPAGSVFQVQADRARFEDADCRAMNLPGGVPVAGFHIRGDGHRDGPANPRNGLEHALAGDLLPVRVSR